MNEATHRGVGTRLPLEQGLTNYYVNVQRGLVLRAPRRTRQRSAELAVVLGGELRGLGRTRCRAPVPAGWHTTCTRPATRR
jgi:hypothetical protein